MFCLVYIHNLRLTCRILCSTNIIESDDKVFLQVKANLILSDGDVAELKGWDEIYCIIYPAGVSQWLSMDPWDLLQDLEVHSLHTTSGWTPEGISSSSFFCNDCQDVHEGILAGWKETLKPILLFLPFSAQTLIHKPSPNRPIWHLGASSSTPSHAAYRQQQFFFLPPLCACDFTFHIHLLGISGSFPHLCYIVIQAYWLNNECWSTVNGDSYNSLTWAAMIDSSVNWQKINIAAVTMFFFSA